jgi:hypothetical protein
MEDKKTLNELWALPINMKELPFDFHGYKLYSSDKLKLKFFEAVLATPWGKHHAKNFQKLLKTNNIVPVLMEKNIRGFLAKKFLSRDWTKNVAGLYSSELGKVLVFIDNNSSWLGLSSNKELVKTTLHELMHLSASSNMVGFFKIMKPTFEQYYGNYYGDIFSCKNNPPMNNVLKALYRLEGVFSTSLHKKYMEALLDDVKPASSLQNEEFNYLFQDIYTVTRQFPLAPNLLMRFYPRYYHIFGPLNDTYVKTFGERNSYTSPAQELWALSEVASVMVELLPVDGRVSKVLANIK